MEKLSEARLPQEFILDAFADPASIRDVVRGILHTIFFHRYFPTLAPQTHEVLDLTLPYVAEPELETLIDQRTTSLIRELDSATVVGAEPTPPHSLSAVVGGFLGGGGSPAPPPQPPFASPPSSSLSPGNNGGSSGRGQISVQFMEKTRRRKLWLKGNDEEVCWESWTVRVTVAEPRTENERAKVRKAMESTLLTTIMKIITSVNTYKEHIPPITTTEANPFPYAITVNQREPGVGGGGGGGWGGRFGSLY